jgi:hypothetical protein
VKQILHLARSYRYTVAVASAIVAELVLFGWRSTS